MLGFCSILSPIVLMGHANCWEFRIVVFFSESLKAANFGSDKCIISNPCLLNFMSCIFSETKIIIKSSTMDALRISPTYNQAHNHKSWKVFSAYKAEKLAGPVWAATWLWHCSGNICHFIHLYKGIEDEHVHAWYSRTKFSVTHANPPNQPWMKMKKPFYCSMPLSYFWCLT